MGFIEANNINMHYEIKGSGPRLLFINGLGTDLKNPISIFNTAVPDYFTVLAFDPRGLGESDYPETPFSIKDMAEDAASLASAFGWVKYHLLGASMGGMVAQELAINNPSTINRLVLAATHAGGENGAPVVIDKLATMTTLEKLHFSDTRQDEEWAKANPEMVAKFEEQSRLAMEAMVASPELVRGHQYQVEASVKHNTYDRIHLIKARTLILSGLYDGSIPREVAKKMAERIPGSELEFTEHGHGSWYFDPSVWQKVIDFLQK